MEIDTQKFKEKLEAEKTLLRGQLETIAAINPDSKTEDWIAKGSQMNIQQADQNERADVVEEYEIHVSELKNLEVRYNNVKAALLRIENGTYGVDSKQMQRQQPARRT